MAATWTFECPVEFHLVSSRANVGPCYPVAPRAKSQSRVNLVRLPSTTSAAAASSPEPSPRKAPPATATYSHVTQAAADRLASPISSPPGSPGFPPISDVSEASHGGSSSSRLGTAGQQLSLPPPRDMMSGLLPSAASHAVSPEQVLKRESDSYHFVLGGDARQNVHTTTSGATPNMCSGGPRDARHTRGAGSRSAPPDSRSYGRLAAPPPVWRAPVSMSTPERTLPKRWLQGRFQAVLSGPGGCEGGHLRVFRPPLRRPVFMYLIKALERDNGWSITDIQLMHPSVSGRPYAIALRTMVQLESPVPTPTPHMPVVPPTPTVPFAPPMSPVPPTPLSPVPPMAVPAIPREMSESSATSADLATSPTPMSFLNSPSPQLGKKKGSESRFSFNNFLPNRNRSKTVSNSPKQSPDLSGSEWPSNAKDSLDLLTEGDIETVVYVSFQSAQDRDEWYSILRALARSPLEDPDRDARTHRRLKIGVLDLNEALGGPSTTLHPAGRRLDADDLEDVGSAGSISSDGRANSSKLYTPMITRTEDGSVAEAKARSVKPGWSWRETLRVELILDGTLYARTGWIKATRQGGTPFWGEYFNFHELPPFNTACLHLVKHKGDKTPAVFAKVDLPLVSSFANVEDERYPVRSINGGVLGEIRLAVRYQEVDVINLKEYERLHLTQSYHGSKFMYVMGGRGLMEGSAEYLVRIGLCEGLLMERTLDTCSHEAQAAGSTLFRNTTPTSKTLEVIMRLMCGNFLQAAVGPTIRRILKDKVDPKLFYRQGATPGDSPINYRVLNQMRDIVGECWLNMYNARHVFPDFVRHLLKHLFVKVKEHHDDGNDLMQYKAVSSFVFLRLIGPALMSPNLFNLADSELITKANGSPKGLLSGPAQRTLTLVAKVLHTLAFFSDKELLRHPDIALFRGFIMENTDAMMDFIFSLASPVKPYSNVPEDPTPVQRFLSERRTRLPEFQGQAVPHMTDAGPIDLSAEWAVCMETWYEKRRHPGPKLHTAKSSTEDIEHLIKVYDDHLDHVHALAFPEDIPMGDQEHGVELVERISTHHMHNHPERSLTPSPSGPSLSYSSVSPDASTDDLHHLGSGKRLPQLPASIPASPLDSKIQIPFGNSPLDSIVMPIMPLAEQQQLHVVSHLESNTLSYESLAESMRDMSIPEVSETEASNTDCSPDMNVPQTPAESPNPSAALDSPVAAPGPSVHAQPLAGGFIDGEDDGFMSGRSSQAAADFMAEPSVVDFTVSDSAVDFMSALSSEAPSPISQSQQRRPSSDRRHSTPTQAPPVEYEYIAPPASREYHTPSAGIVESVIDPDRSVIHLPLMSHHAHTAGMGMMMPSPANPFAKDTPGFSGPGFSPPQHNRSIRRKRRPTLPNLLLLGRMSNNNSTNGNGNGTAESAPPVPAMPPMPWAERPSQQ